MKTLIGQSVKDPFAALTPLIDSSYDGDLEYFCNVSEFLRPVSDDLQPLDNDLISDVGHSPERFAIFPHKIGSKLCKINGRKSCGPGELPNRLFTPDFTNPLLHTLPGSFWIAFTDLEPMPD